MHANIPHPRFAFIRRWWILIASVVCLLSAMTHLLFNRLLSGRIFTGYGYTSCFTLIASLMMLLVVTYYLFEETDPHFRKFGIISTLPMLWPALGISGFVLLISLIFPPRFLASTTFNEHVYHFADTFDFDSNQSPYELYECDRYGLLCRLIDDKTCNPRYPLESSDTQLHHDNGIITVTVDSQIVCTYEVER